VWNRRKNGIAWRPYLGERADGTPVSPIAAPGRMDNLERSIPASILTDELDLYGVGESGVDRCLERL
jgi:hypothetical protein